MRRVVAAIAATSAASLLPGVAASAETASSPVLARVHLGNRNLQADAPLFGAPSISGDGRFVAFASTASNLVANDTNGTVDVFVRDRALQTTERVSVSSLGLEGLGASFSPVISADGRWVAFTSYAPNLVLGDLNGLTGAGSDVFLHDRRQRTTVLVSKPKVGFSNGESDFPSISADGRFVAFDSTADNLVDGDTNGTGDVFVWDVVNDSLRRIGSNTPGGEFDAGSGLASISADGSRVAFLSAATNLVADDRNGYVDAFVADLHTGEFFRVNVTSDGSEAQGDAESVTLSGDGLTAAVVTAWPLAGDDKDYSFDVYTHDLRTRQTTLVSSGRPGSGVDQPRASYAPVLSDDGRWIVYTSGDAQPPADGGAAPGSQVYLRDLRSGVQRMISTPPAGDPDDISHAPAISGDGRHIAFASNAQNLVPFDNNHASDAFALDLGEPRYAVGGPTSMPRDVYPPDTTITSGPPPYPSPAPARFTFAANEAGVRFECRLDADPQTVGDEEGWSECKAAHSVTAPPGEHRLEVRAIDSAGNADASPAQRVFILR
jgi:Tol biopolymer transport system component